MDIHTYRRPKQGKPGRNQNSSPGSVLVSKHYRFVKQCWLVYITGLYRVQVSEKYRFNFDNVPTFCKEITKQGYLKVGLFRLRAGSYIWTCPYLKMGISFFRQSETGGHSPKKKLSCHVDFKNISSIALFSFNFENKNDIHFDSWRAIRRLNTKKVTLPLNFRKR